MPILRAAIFCVGLELGGTFRVKDEAITAKSVAEVIQEMSNRLCRRLVPYPVPDVIGGQPEWFRLFDESGQTVGGLVGIIIERSGERIRPMHQVDFPLLEDDLVIVSSVA